MRAVNNKYFFITLLFLLTSLLLVQTSKSQSIKLVAGNALNGAMNGVALGGATMALQKSNDFAPVRVGLGAGILYGISVGVYDVSTIKTGQQFYISGTFNDGTNTSILILLDTFYGAASGAVIATSISLIAKEPVVEALRYGSGIGAWAGFGFGLVDAFVLSSRPGNQTAASHHQTSGLLTYRNAVNNFELGLISPTLIQTTKISAHGISSQINPSLDILQVNIRL